MSGKPPRRAFRSETGIWICIHFHRPSLKAPTSENKMSVMGVRGDRKLMIVNLQRTVVTVKIHHEYAWAGNPYADGEIQRKQV
jgi:hypothetical protein